MAGETNLSELVKGMTPKLNDGDYVFSTIKDVSKIDRKNQFLKSESNKLLQ